MENYLFRQNETQFLSERRLNQWLGVLALIGLSCLNLIWPLATMILLIALVMLLCFILRPYVALLITIFLMAFQSFSLTYVYPKFNPGASLFLFMAFLGLLCWCVARLAKVTPPYQFTTIDTPLIVFYFTGIFALLWTPYLFDGLKILLTTTLCYSLYLLISALNNTFRDLKRLYWLFFGLGNLVVITTIASFFFERIGASAIHNLTDSIAVSTFVKQFTGSRETVWGTIGGPKAIATLMDFCIFCGLTLFCTRERRSSKILVFLSIFAMLFIHFLTISRIETAGLLLGWLTFVYLNPQWRHKRIRAHFMMLCTVFAVLLALIVMLSSFYTTKYLFARSLVQEQSVGYRFSGSQNRWDHYAHSLLGLWETGGLGAGAGGIMKGMDPSTDWMDSASLYMSVLTDHGYGILSFMLMLWIMVNIIIELRWALNNCPDPQHKIFIIGVCSSFVMFGTPLSDMFYYVYIMWVILGFTVVAVKSVRCLNKSHPDPSLGGYS